MTLHSAFQLTSPAVQTNFLNICLQTDQRTCINLIGIPCGAKIPSPSTGREGYVNVRPAKNFNLQPPLPQGEGWGEGDYSRRLD